MSLFRNILLDPATVSLDAGSRVRTSQMTTLLDGKTLNSDSPFLFDNAGTGTGTYANNKYNMSDKVKDLILISQVNLNLSSVLLIIFK